MRLIITLLITLFITLGFYAPTLWASGPATRFEHLTIDHGLSQSSVFATLQDSKGFMWFGTEDGLNRYDGYEFKVFRHDPQNPHSISRNLVRFIYEDAKNNLWVGTNGGGLNLFDRGTERFVRYRHHPLDPHSLGHDDVRSIFEDDNGVLWVGTNGGGLNQFDPKAQRFKRFTHDPKQPNSISHNRIRAIYQDSQKRFWVGTVGGGLNLFDRKTEGFEHFKHQPNNPDSLSHNSVYALFESPEEQDILWVGTWGGGLNRFDTNSAKFSHFKHQPDNPHSISHDKVLSITSDGKDQLLLGTYGGGLNRFNIQQQRFERFSHQPADPHSLSDNRVSPPYKDANGLLWIGTVAAGINKYNSEQEHFVHFKKQPSDPYSLSHNGIRAFFHSQTGANKTLWVGTAGGGLNRLDRQSGRFTHFKHDPTNPNSLSHNNIQSIVGNPKGMMWIATFGGGLNKFNPQTGENTRFINDPANPNSVSDNYIIEQYLDPEGSLWLGTFGNGLNRFDIKTNQVERFYHQPNNPDSLSNDFIRSFLVDKDGVLWLGTNDGLNQYNAQTGKFKVYKNQLLNAYSLSHSAVQTLHQDKQGTLWVGTSGGLNKFDPATSTFVRYGEKEGLPNDYIYGILEGQRGHLWLSTNNGLSRFDPVTEVFKNYDANDGLQSNEFNGGAYYKAANGELFFGGINGFNRFFPDNIADDKQVPRVVLTDFLLANQSVAVKHKAADSKASQAEDLPFTLPGSIDSLSQLTLTYQQNLIAFEFAALQFANPMKNQYAYKLEGQDPDWIVTTAKNRRATYTNLSPGQYTLHIKASNKDGYWNEQGKSLKLTILPPPWQTWWAYGIYSLLLALAIATLIHIQRRTVRFEHALNLQLEDKVSARTAQLEQKNSEVVEAQQQLAHAEKMASLGTMTAGVAHEISNPTSFLQISANNLDSELTSVEQFLANLGEIDKTTQGDISQRFVVLHQHLSTIKNGTERINTIVEDLWTFTQPDNAERKTVKITDLLQDTIELVQTKYLEVTEFTTLFNASPQIKCYPTQLNQVFMNLIVNACDAIVQKQQQDPTYHGEVMIRCQLLNRAVEITIKDNGCGMTDETKKKLFEPFFTTKEKGAGTGLGLSIAFGIVQKHQGELLVESELGLGSTFRLRLKM
ncbi:MAG: signal transduction histidine kinase/ligand-binding sensor domain-containing protein [Phenylobacterium sp.]|jgi:signal transduction histidine kinase/ligand-binding sensor domain-containing protein